MAFTHSITISCSPNGGVAIGGTISVSSGAENNISESIAGATTNGLLAYTADVSQMKSLVLYCPRDILIETNDGTTPDASINLKAGKPLIWESTQGQTNPLGIVDVAELYVTLAAGDAAVLEILALVDPTV